MCRAKDQRGKHGAPKTKRQRVQSPASRPQQLPQVLVLQAQGRVGGGAVLALTAPRLPFAPRGQRPRPGSDFHPRALATAGVRVPDPVTRAGARPPIMRGGGAQPRQRVWTWRLGGQRRHRGFPIGFLPA